MPKARLYFDGDNSGIEKEARIYSLTQEVEDKLDSISNFQDEIDDLQDQINNLASRGRYLSTWNAVTGLPGTDPQVDPYVYRAGDYYIVSVVGGTNYRPTGSEYHVGVASQVVESQSVSQNDLYIYDGIQWVLQGSGSSLLAVWGSITGTLSAQTDLQNSLDAKANKTDVLEKTNTTSYTPTADYHPATKKYADDNDTFIGATAPTNNVIEGRLWYDTTADVLKVYNGSQWVPTGKTYTAGSHIEISNADVISTTGLQEKLTAGENITIGDVCTTESDMKGPCPSGFHVPLNTERQTVYDVWTALGGGADDGDNFRIALKIPKPGYRSRNGGSVINSGVYGYYWSSSRDGSNRAYVIYIHSSVLNPQYSQYRTNGLLVRCFSNSPVIPTSTWTKLYGTSIENGGIFWSATDGLISLSSNGQTWVTIADKNLGATTVWNSGDALSEANCGNFYQWGNNYSFPFAGNVTTSSTQVDASTYGPGNYYSSDIFITGNSWDSSNNRNLRGGESQGTFQDCIHNVISTTDTTYTAGTGLSLSNGEFSVDTTTIATKADIANLGTFVVVDTLPTAASADEKTIYLLGPIGTGADKYEEWIITRDYDWASSSTLYPFTVNRNTWDGAIFIDSQTSPLSDFHGDCYVGAKLTSIGDGTKLPVKLSFRASSSVDSEWVGLNEPAFAYNPDQYPNGDDLDIYIPNTSSSNSVSITAEGVMSSSPITWELGPKQWTKIGETSIDLSTKQDVLTPSTGISIDSSNNISNTLPGPTIAATAPTGTEGTLWYDTTNDQLKVYDGTNWNVTGKEYNAGEGIEIGTIQDYSAMQGPAPDGFHVPLTTEWQAVRDIRVALGGGSSDGTNFGIALKLPFAGYRHGSSAGVGDQGTYGSYWSSSRYNADNAYYLRFNSTGLNPQNNYRRAYGYSVRCFKNTPTIPTSSWTKLYGTSIESGGIFWSSTEGLISMSSDGQTWVTIADKNLGATTVWNSGDTLSEANCGKHYQRGNNYGFPRTGGVTTSGTQVDASTYGPGNYYSSSTFITRSSSPYRWDSTDNGNLWGGETGVVTYDNAIINTGVLSVNGQTGDISNVVTGDGQYVINVSTTAPASGTANSVITFVTD